MTWVLKEYQERCLTELATYLKRTYELRDANTAFYEQTRRPYRDVKSLPGLPYVCVRVPTGGGKTVLASHAVGIAANLLLRMDRCLVLWLAPTTQIVRQTLDALRNKEHPYRQALDESFDGCVSVMDLSAALFLRRSTLESDTVVIVSTLAAMRVENTEGRKIYEANGYLMDSFTGLSDAQKIELNKTTEHGGTAPSLANLLRIRRPVVIVDEAHNARTLLSFDTLARFGPSCILEFSATPDQDPKGEPSNVLTHVSAAELKAEEMIKLPIRLKTRAQWKEAVAEALSRQSELERLAAKEELTSGDYIKPIVLLQAQRNVKGEANITYDVLKQSLIEDFNILEAQIAIATGGIDELKDREVLKQGEETRFIITVDKLREGWDCPFAYVLCSVSTLSAKTAVEQILGRILRLPYARRKQHDDLNHAYAYVTSQGFVDSANALTDALVQSGFEEFEAKSLVKAESGQLDFGPLFAAPVTETVSTKPSLESLSSELRERITVQPDAATETIKIVYTGPALTDDEANAVRETVQAEDDKKAVERLIRKSRGEDCWPAAMGEKMRVPVLAVRSDGQLELFEDQFREVPWHLSQCDPTLTEKEFSIAPFESKVADVDIDEKGKIGYTFVDELQKQLTFLDLRGPKTEAELAVWLDRAINHPDVTQTEAGLFLRKMIQSLIKDREITLEQLVVNRFRLRDAAEAIIHSHRSSSTTQAYQQMLLPDAAAPLEVDPNCSFEFPLNQYPATRLYDGPMNFRRHYYEVPAQMNGEEAECAAIIDGLSGVKYWVRNLERDRFAFWLQTATDKFYPDFVVMLNDGRYLVIEYKGAHLLEKTSELEKKMIGELWAARSKGRCIFCWATKSNMHQAIPNTLS